MAPRTTKEAVQNSLKEEIEETKEKLKNLGYELMDVEWKKIACTAIITGNGPLEEKVAAQGQHEELVNKQHELNIKKQRAEKRLLVLDEKQSILEYQHQFAV
ncbi:hypothetical protein FCOIX_3197 [Fusarium coicis]|nr:hypothetical protein FCOIX_3197 [Fusarium coicis]